MGYERRGIRTISMGAGGGGTRTGLFFLSSLSPALAGGSRLLAEDLWE
jgi:hypothetical protein